MFPGALRISRRISRLYVQNVVGNLGKGSGESEGILRREGEHFIGYHRCVGNEGLWDIFNNGHLGMSTFIVSQTLVCY